MQKINKLQGGLFQWLVLLTLVLGFASQAQAQLKIDISGVGGTQINFSVAPFVGNPGLPEDIQKIVEADLVRSGYFKNISTTANLTLDENSTVEASAWKGIGVDAVVAGSVKKLSDGRLDVRFNLHDTVNGKSLGKFSYTVVPSALRLTAHRIADFVYEKFMGEPGIFATRLAYVEKSPGRYRLIIADSDGYNPQVALNSREPIISPSWSPDGTKLAYVSFESRKPVIYIHTLATGKRTTVANFKGSNSAPVWAPDGRSLAIVLTKDGGSQIFLIDADGGNLRKVTNTGNGINTEPAFSTDGKTIYFTSDRSGGPQIYRMDTSGGSVSRVTFSGDYNISPKVSPDGKTLAYVTRRGGQFRVATLDLRSGGEALLTNSSRDESPSYSPNGRYILYATKSGSRGVLAMVSNDGKVRQELASSAADIAEPTWGPYNQE